MAGSQQSVVQRQTIKQAKAAFKDRGRPSLSEKEQKQLERSIQLEKRAWGVKEREKRKAEQAKKKAEKERKEKAERERISLGSQRRRDKFGYKSSQFHLGAFFGAGAGKKADIKAEKENEPAKVDEADEGFGDDGLDDDMLLDVLESPKLLQRQQHPQSDGATSSVVQAPQLPRSKSEPLPLMPTEDDFADFLDDLGSSTQISRELALDDSKLPVQQEMVKPIAGTGSFSSGDFDMTAEEFDEMFPAEPVLSKAESDRKLMPPPAIPVERMSAKPCSGTKPKQPGQGLPSQPPPPPVQTPGFSLAELESFVDDDLQLTQLAPG